MKHKTAFIGVSFALALILSGALLTLAQRRNSKGKSEAYKDEFFAMDTVCSVTLYGEENTSEYRTLIVRLNNELDRYNEDSEVYKFNTAGSTALTGSAAELYQKSKELYGQYGVVDVTCGGLILLWGVTDAKPSVPADDEIKAELAKVGFDKIQQEGSVINSPSGTKLDFGAVAKGYALDKVKEKLSDSTIDCAVVSLGSSTLLYGQKPDGEPFKTGVKDPFSPDKLILTFESGEGFVSTSGGYERYFEADGKRYIHILDLATGRPSESDLASVTVICDSGLKSDFLSTAIFIGGTKGLDKYLSDDSIKVIAIDNNKKIYSSPSLDDSIELTGE